MTISVDDLRLFAHSVTTTLEVVRRLRQAMLDERQALTGNSADALTTAVETKSRLLDELAPLLQSRDQLQQRLGLPAGIAGGDQLMSGAPADLPVRQQWDEMKDLARQIEQANAVNGQLATQGEKTTRECVAILTGRSRQPSTYGRQGRQADALQGHSLARA